MGTRPNTRDNRKLYRYPGARLALLCLLLILAGCIRPEIGPVGLEDIDRSRLPAADTRVRIPGLGPCSDQADRTLHLNSGEPVTVLVHGCYGSAGRFRSLSQVFAFHGQQTACFSYDYLDSMEKSSAELVTALNALNAELDGSQVNLVAHSQGGLIGRRALIEDRTDGMSLDTAPRELVTISTPFAGIEAASHCGSRLAHVLTLGVTVGVCRLISGDKWWEITAASNFIQEPGTLPRGLERHLKIVTDERGTCRERDGDGRCLEDDLVFSLAEQYFPPVDADSRVANLEVAAGHGEIVGNHLDTPVTLITILQQQGILDATPASRQADLERLLTALYAPDSSD